jgi:hypothetical protein
VPVAEFPTLNVIAEELSERLVNVCVEEVVAVGAVEDEFPPQVTVTTVAMTVPRKPMLRVVTSISFHSRRPGDQVAELGTRTTSRPARRPRSYRRRAGRSTETGVSRTVSDAVASHAWL